MRAKKKEKVGRGQKILMGFEEISLLDKRTILHAWNESKLTSLNTSKPVDTETTSRIIEADSIYGENLESKF